MLFKFLEIDLLVSFTLVSIIFSSSNIIMKKCLFVSDRSGGKGGGSALRAHSHFFVIFPLHFAVNFIGNVAQLTPPQRCVIIQILQCWVPQSIMKVKTKFIIVIMNLLSILKIPGGIQEGAIIIISTCNAIK